MLGRIEKTSEQEKNFDIEGSVVVVGGESSSPTMINHPPPATTKQSISRTTLPEPLSQHVSPTRTTIRQVDLIGLQQGTVAFNASEGNYFDGGSSEMSARQSSDELDSPAAPSPGCVPGGGTELAVVLPTKDGKQGSNTSEPGPFASQYHFHGQETHHLNIYDPVFREVEESEADVLEEATAAVYAKEVLGPPGSDEDMSLAAIHQEESNASQLSLPVVAIPAARSAASKTTATESTSSVARAETPTTSLPTTKHQRHTGSFTTGTTPLATDSATNSVFAGLQNEYAGPAAKGSGSKKVHDEQWNEMLERLRAYKNEHGDCLVPKRYIDQKLAIWVDTQKTQYKRLPRVYSEELGYEVPQPNKRLTQERLNKLQELGFSWTAKQLRKNGPKADRELAVCGSGIDKNSTFHSDLWTHTSTQNNKRKASPEAWGEDMPRSIAAGIKEQPLALAYQTEECHVEKSSVLTQYELGQQRNDSNSLQAKLRGHVSQQSTSQKRQRVLSIPPNTSTNEKIHSEKVWEEMFARLLLFKEREGHCMVPRKCETDPKLATWAENQRGLWNREYNQGRLRNKSAELIETTDLNSKRQEDETGTNTRGAVKQLSQDRKDRLDAVGFVWSLRSKRIEDHWDQMFGQLVQYKDQHGDCLVPSRYEVNPRLGKWVESQRYEFTKLKRASSPDSSADTIASASVNLTSQSTRSTSTRLTPDRLRRLQSIGFEWKVKNKMKRYYDKQWDSMFQRLMDFRREYGHVNVPKRFTDTRYPRLANWVHTQRIQYRKLMAGIPNSEISKTLSKAKDAPPSCARMSETTPSLHSSQPAEFPPKNEEATTLPSFDQGQSFRLTEERRQRLEQIGFCWSAREGERSGLGNSTLGRLGEGLNNGNDTETIVAGRMSRNSYDDKWDAMFALLEEYKAEHGNCLVPKRYSKLGVWCDTQRVQYKKLQKKLAEARTLKSSPDASNSGLESFACTPLGRADTPNSLLQGKTCDVVVGRLTQERIQRLENLGFVWSLRDDWTKHYEELKAYKQKHGHCNVPARYKENRRLGIFVSSQRQQYKILQHEKELKIAEEVLAGKQETALGHSDSISPSDPSNAKSKKSRRATALTEERINLLNKIGFTWTIRSRDSPIETWNQRMHELRHFKLQHGHCLVPPNYEKSPELGHWIGLIRTQYRLYCGTNGTCATTSLNDTRIQELEALGFVWEARDSSFQDGTFEVPTTTTVGLDTSGNAMPEAKEAALLDPTDGIDHVEPEGTSHQSDYITAI